MWRARWEASFRRRDSVSSGSEEGSVEGHVGPACMDASYEKPDAGLFLSKWKKECARSCWFSNATL